MTTDAVLNAPDLSLTAAAAQRIADLSRLEGRPLMLRIGVDAGGCSGFQYQFELVEAAAPDDDIFEVEIWSTGPVFWIRANEFDDIGYFSSLAEARAYAEEFFEGPISELLARGEDEE